MKSLCLRTVIGSQVWVFPTQTLNESTKFEELQSREFPRKLLEKKCPINDAEKRTLKISLTYKSLWISPKLYQKTNGSVIKEKISFQRDVQS